MFQLLKCRQDYEGFFYAYDGQYYYQDWRGLKAMVDRTTIDKAEGISVLLAFNQEESMVEWVTDQKWKRLLAHLYD